MRATSRADQRPVAARALLFGFILLCHALLFLLVQRGLIHVPLPAEQPLLLFSVPQPPPQARPATPLRALQHRTQTAPPATAVPPADNALPAVAAAPRPPANIDWSQEATLAAQHQMEPAAAAAPRSLDDHHGRRPLAGLNSSGPDRFGWDYAATHRVESAPGLLVIHVSDRCAIAILLILPSFACGFGGEIPVNGDLFKHMHDPP